MKDSTDFVYVGLTANGVQIYESNACGCFQTTRKEAERLAAAWNDGFQNGYERGVDDEQMAGELREHLSE